MYYIQNALYIPNEVRAVMRDAANEFQSADTIADVYRVYKQYGRNICSLWQDGMLTRSQYTMMSRDADEFRRLRIWEIKHVRGCR